MIRLLGRQTSGNVRNVLFLPEEPKSPDVREDYRRQCGNTTTEAYRKLNPNSKVPTVIDGAVTLRPTVKRCLGFPIERPDRPELTRRKKSIEARPAFAVAIGAKPGGLTSAA
ncbi:MAG: hypothetical protein F9K38_10850 [Pseudorhodoplanes sp.]|nr:MAG: hypothetical protein F9K38_10850 [Pseudorhodoplanes sp.]